MVRLVGVSIGSSKIGYSYVKNLILISYYGTKRPEIEGIFHISSPSLLGVEGTQKGMRKIARELGAGVSVVQRVAAAYK